MKVGLIDYGRGNLRSVEKALQKLHAEVRRISGPEDFAGCDAVVLPGVGAFGDAMNNLHDRKLVQPVREWLDSDRPFLGICLGFQLLFEESDESPGVKGLGWMKGRVVRFPDSLKKIPHMGWNVVQPVNQGVDLFRGLPGQPYFYHVHSYYPEPADADDAACHTEYDGVRFVSGVARGSKAAFQFHPEKSQRNGLMLLENFLNGLAVPI